MAISALRYAVGSEVYATVVNPDSDEMDELRRFQDQHFGRLQGPRGGSHSYGEATSAEASRIIPVAVRRRPPDTDGADEADAPHELIGMSRLELPGATLIESMIALREGSASARALAYGRAAEISSFAVADSVERGQIINVVDAVVGVMVELARAYQIEWLWVFPRVGFMSLIRAEIPGALPPYHFTLSPDIAGWIEDSPQLAAFRAMHLKGFADAPFFYQIATDTMRDDLDLRARSRERRLEMGQALAPQMKRAMVAAERTLRQEIALFYPAAYTRAMRRAPAPTEPSVEAFGLSGVEIPVARPTDSFLPAGLIANTSLGRYLNQVVNDSGDNARAYKELSYSLLNPRPGMRVLDVGCGAGVDLPALSKLVGPIGATVGLELNTDLVNEARALAARIDEPAASPIFVVHGDALNMTIPSAEFDRVRTDRALQHIPRPERAVAEMWRILKPGGVLTLVEPDWGSMVVAPGGAVGPTDETVSKVFAWSGSG